MVDGHYETKYYRHFFLLPRKVFVSGKPKWAWLVWGRKSLMCHKRRYDAWDYDYFWIYELEE